ncbi:hypothetical protein TVAG_388510 [Trichomonas vaginalis G3]|uniref:Uncharacterized protein n=1 Tax=Trichomonas vaginalis (strain ATCC PRA-98 / G3) TaxID=412133 RepID=A2DYI4_TRIV3|nr:hypothetical protein TVAGG3_0321170 [Trichomonas vaginalis G3]EAY14519.1 hypothetical protein TVAG_388510 [Trichomonas vaginalis G3]KAI5529308.1 hypothetical protein TVAGG3_0321170 [Trichomonas vaginalis G3]|eukprot:XP_001326742.1 hypothetical protein [Trichomonas vaginalis G3]
MICFLLIAALSIQKLERDEGDLLESVLDEIKSLRQEVNELQKSLPKENFYNHKIEKELPQAREGDPPSPAPTIPPPPTPTPELIGFAL